MSESQYYTPSTKESISQSQYRKKMLDMLVRLREIGNFGQLDFADECQNVLQVAFI